MSSRRRSAAVPIAALLVAFSVLPVHAQGPELIAAPADDSPPSVRLAPGTNSAAITAYVRQHGDTPLMGVLRIDQLVDDMGRQPGSGTISVTQRGGDVDEPVTIPAAGALVAVDISVNALEDVGTFSAQVTLDTDAQSLALGRVSVIKDPVVAFTIVGADTNGLAIAASRPVITRWIQIDSQTDQDMVVSISISGLVGPDGEAACASLHSEGTANAVTCDEPAATSEPSASPAGDDSPPTTASPPISAEDVNIGARGSARVLLTARLEADGAYETVATIAWDGGRHDVPIVVTRSFADSPFDVHGPPVVHAGHWPFGSSSTTFTVVANPKSLRPFTLPPPAFVVPLAREDAGTSESANIDAAFDPEHPYQVDDSLSRSFQVTLSNITQQGTYNGEIKLAAVDHQGATVPVKLIVRDEAFAALVTIGLGVVLAYGVTRFLREVRPRLSRERAIRERLERLTEMAARYRDDPDAGPVVRDVLSQASVLIEDNRAGASSAADLDERSEVLRLKTDALPRWITLLPLAKVLRRFKPEHEAVKRADALRGTLSRTDPLATTKSQLADLGALGTALAEALRKTLGEAIDASQTLARDAASWVGPDLLARLTAEVDPAITFARNSSAEERWRDAADAVRKAQAGLIEIVALGMLKVLGERPAFLADATFTAKLDELRDRLRGTAMRANEDPEDALLRLGAQRKDFYKLAREALDKWIRETAQSPPQPPAKPPNLKPAEQALEALGAAVAEPADLEKAAAAYRAAVVATRRFAAAPRGVGAAPVVEQVTPLSIEDPALIERQVGRRIANVLLLLDVATFAILALAASVIGLGVLWAPNATWGTATDYLTALLFGFGLTAAGAPATTTTVDSLWRQLSKPVTA